MSTDTLNDTTLPEVAGEDMGDLLATPEVVVPPEEPEAHRGTILGVTVQVASTGSTSFRVSLQSIDTGREDVMDLWLPRGFVEDINVLPANLPDDEGNRQRTSYSIGVFNSKKDGVIQSLQAIAKKAGRVYRGVKPTTFAEYVAAHNELLSGLEIVYTKRPDKPKEGEDLRFAGRLRVGTIMSQDDAFNPKALKKYRKMWEQQ